MLYYEQFILGGVKMERYLLSLPEVSLIDWTALLSDWPGTRLIYDFPSGKAYIETSPEILHEMKVSLPELYSEKIFHRGSC